MDRFGGSPTSAIFFLQCFFNLLYVKSAILSMLIITLQIISNVTRNKDKHFYRAALFAHNQPKIYTLSRNSIVMFCLISIYYVVYIVATILLVNESKT